MPSYDPINPRIRVKSQVPHIHTHIYICTVCKKLRETPVGSWYLMKYILCAKKDKYVLRAILITS